jgi:hypothetical protein
MRKKPSKKHSGTSGEWQETGIREGERYGGFDVRGSRPAKEELQGRKDRERFCIFFQGGGSMKRKILMSLTLCFILAACSVNVPKNDVIVDLVATQFGLPLKLLQVWGVTEKTPYELTYKIGVSKTDYLMKFRFQQQEWRVEQVKIGDNWVPAYQAQETIIYNLMKRWMSDVTVALQNFFQANNRYPSTLSELKDVSIKDPWDNDYVYEPRDEFYRYTLTCIGPDGKLGGPDDLTVNELSEWSR